MQKEAQKQDPFDFMKAFFALTRRWSAKELKRFRTLTPPSDIGARTQLKKILRDEFAVLKDKPAGLSERTRGFRLERLLYKFLFLENLKPSSSYYALRGKGELIETEEITEDDDAEEESGPGRKSGGEQIDGFFDLDGRFFLVEAKWTKPIPASALYAFRGLVEGRLAGTLGLFVSAGNFADDAEHALMWGKEICILLADASDLECALEDGNSFAEMIRMKLREAARVGQVYYSYRNYVDERNA